MRVGIPTTTPMRMLLDLGAVDAAGVVPALRQVVASKVVSPKAVHAFLVRHAKRGRHGVTALRQALDDLLIEGRPRDSELEARVAALLTDHGLPAADFHALVEGFEVDFLVVGTRVILECDGWASHGLDRDQFEFDRMRDAALLAAGYVTVRCTWRQVVETPAKVARRLEEVLRQWYPEVFVSASAARFRPGAGTIEPQNGTR